MIQKQIYSAAKSYNLVYMYRLQEYLLNSNEAKIVSIKQVLKETYKYYYNCKTENYKKFVIFKFLFNIKFFKTEIDSIIVEQVKQHLVHLCIEPECKSKFTKQLYKNLNANKFNLFIKNNLDELNFIQQYKRNKYLLTKILASKLRLHKYILQSIKNWFYKNYLINLHNIKLKKYTKAKINIINYFISSNLLLLLFMIIAIDLKWYFFHVKHIKFVLNHIDLIQNDILQNINTNISLINLIKLFLYHKNNLNQWRVNTLINKKNIFTKLNQVLQKYYNNKLQFISITLIKYNNNLLNRFIYYWLKKVYRVSRFYFLTYYNVKINNYFINKYIYNYNIDNYYINLF
uniref:Reverse transcriptase N-terminal domain-containing protein n=1 Tax=Bostrychia tenella TaxID=324755 RepID=A0A1Z1M5E8_9FLOR|nr:hypothetical protein [Bostrychia tenella]ARW61226.1 hypothetical protein [Bostrychia tenella]